MPFPDLPAPLAHALAERGYAEPTPVQAAVLDAATAGRDLLVSAQTGSGKTVAYGLALTPELLGEGARLPPAGAPLALVVAPTRELAMQVRVELAWLYGAARVVACVGGTDPVAERRLLASGAHIVVGTPGRTRDHIERGNLRPGSLRAVVLDEADEMLDLGFREDLEAILEAAPAERRTLLFSATVPAGIASLARGYQRDALRIEASGEGRQHADIEYRAATVAPQDLERAVVNILRLEDPRSALVFCATRASVARLHGNLAERGFGTVALSGELSQAERTRALQMLRDGRARVCVATDVAARGIDLPGLDLVIHAELPRDPETLLHRSGRTGRAGRKGVSLLLVPRARRRAAERLLMGARVQAAWAPAPSAEAVRARDDERVAAQAATLAAVETSEDELAAARALLADPALAGRGPEAVASAFLRILRAPLPAPEELAAVDDRPAFREGRDAGPRDAGPRPAPAAGAWFRAAVGRAQGADPRWLLPLLCRRGGVTRDEIGRIRIADGESQFEVAAYAAARFAEAAARPAAGEDGRLAIEPLGGPSAIAARRETVRPARPAPFGDRRPAPRRARG